MILTSLHKGYYQNPLESFNCGAPPPFIIHEQKAKKDSASEKSTARLTTEDTVEIPITYLLGLEKDDSTDNLNACGFDVRISSKTGSITQDLFFEYCHHFVRCIKDQSEKMNIGPGYQPVILFLDGHNSRWNDDALEYLLLNNVYCLFLPSKTSIWSQPNDNGVNCKIHRKMNDAVLHIRNQFQTAFGAAEFYNRVIKMGWTSFLASEKDELLSTGSNCTTSCFMKTGLYPFNPKCISWKGALETIGKCNIEMQPQVERYGRKNNNVI